MNRLVVVSNRVPLPEKGAQAGGLATALEPVLRREGGLWFGWSGAINEEAEESPPRIVQNGQLSYATIDLTPVEHQGYYANFANGVLWPLLHSLPELMRFDRSDADVYLAANARFADLLLGQLRGDDLIWVHDYHLLPLPGLLRARGVGNPIGFFLHIPFPGPDLFALAPPASQLLEALLEADLIGFQTDGDVANFIAAAETLAGARRRGSDRLDVAGREVRLGVFPAEIDAQAFAASALRAVAAPSVARLRQSLTGQSLILGVDRLDPTKGLVQRINGYRRLLEGDAGLRRRVSFLQIAPVSREDVASYKALRIELSRTAGQLNSEFGDPDWSPLRLVAKGSPRDSVAGYMRSARVALVTPLRDGMNLVAKEYVAAQAPEDPGVLILSRFAGAARQLDTALLVNPNDPDAIADALNRALQMERSERQARWRAMWNVIADRSPLNWGLDFVHALQRAAQKQSPAARLEIVSAPVPRPTVLRPVPLASTSSAIN